MRPTLLAALIFTAVTGPLFAAERPAPLKALLVIGGCCHDYATQKDLLKAGLETRANLVVDIAYSPDKNTRPALPILGNPDYAKGYDIVIHDECGAELSDVDLIQGVLAPHRAGIPGVNLHCAMHCYRVGNFREKAAIGEQRGAWFEYLGLQSSGHGPQLPIAISYSAGTKSPITAGFADWTTIKEEHYNNVQIYPTATVLARGKQTVKNRQGKETENDYAVVWTNDYHGTRVLSTTIGHNNATVNDPRYLDLVTRGLLWACKKLDDAGNPRPGYGPAK
jgi:hypothetical protein